jgi:FkbH-like protein/FkbM family methyltransferase
MPETSEKSKGLMELKVDRKNYGFIAGHRVNQLPVVPGALFISWAAQSGQRHLADVEFLQMVPLDLNSAASFEFGSEGERTTISAIGADAPCMAYSGAERASEIPVFPEVPDTGTVTGDSFYEQLNGNGNNYEGSFRPLREIAAERDVASRASWTMASDSAPGERLVVLIDSFTHLVASICQRSAVYYLNSISEFMLLDTDVPTELKLRGVIDEIDGNNIRASVAAFDNAGNVIAWVKGIGLKFEAERPTLSVAYGGTFNLDPLSEFFNLWQDKLDITVNQRAADYGQMIPELIRGDGVFDGSAQSQTCFIRLQDWGQTAVHDAGDTQASAQSFPASLDTYALPDKRTVASLNQYETSYLYKEIYVDQAYRRHNVIIADGDVVIDIGANIGLFSMFASEQASNVKVIAVEPSPSVLPILKANLATYAQEHHVVAAGAADKTGEAEFTAYKKSSVFSSFMANKDDDRSAIKQVVINMLSVVGDMDADELEDAAEDMMQDRMDSEQYMCPLVAVSDIVDDQQVEKIGLLKIDAEKSEEAILKGIREEHWDRIEQIIIEVHKQSGIGVAGVRQLLESKGFECIEDEEQLLLDSGLVTIYAARPERLRKNAELSPASKIEKSAGLFVDAVTGLVAAGNTKDLNIVVCPSVVMDPSLEREITRIEDRIGEQCSELKSVKVLNWSDWCNQYPVNEFHDKVSDQAGHIPYTGEWYAATSTNLVRSNLYQVQRPRKVIVLDCDNTLWQGVVGEDGVDGIAFNEPNLTLQRFVKDLSGHGYLLCLASKNDEDIVRRVFSERAGEMLLSWDDIVAHRINWTSKPENLVSMSHELNLNLDSFVFFDDSPAECQQMIDAHPQVMTIAFDEQAGTTEYLAGIWGLEATESTAEDAKRTDMYVVESKRQALRSELGDLEKFIEKIDLNVDIAPVDEESLQRASQMCMRTNQFNFTSKRYTEADIRDLIANDACFVEKIHVTDTFGDYGITGLVIGERKGQELCVDTFLLSCRVLGRSVEHRTLAHIGAKALDIGCDSVRFEFVTTDRNTPAVLFLQSIDDLNRAGSKDQFVYSAQELAELKFRAPANSDTVADGADRESEKVRGEDYTLASEKVHLIASQLNSASSIASAVHTKIRVPRPKLNNAYIAPADKAQTDLVAVWEDLLGIDGIGVEDSFFDLGGTSLKGVEMIARVQREIELKINVANLFEGPTVAFLAQAGAQGNQTQLKRSSRAKGRRRSANRRGDQLAQTN